MTTPIIILSLLILPFLSTWVISGPEKARFGGVLGISFAFVFFGIGHYAQTPAMVEMLPEFVPFRRPLILTTGLLEFVIAIGFLFPSTKRYAGVLAVAVLILFFPANIYAALNHQGMGGHQWGPVYLLIRGPLQAFLIGWTWHIVVSQRSSNCSRIKRSREDAEIV